MASAVGQSDNLVSIPAQSQLKEWPVSGKTTIFARACYKDLFNLCQQAWEQRQQFVWVRGTPGVGKSYFLDYVLAELMKGDIVESKCSEIKSIRVLVISGPLNKAILFENHKTRPTEFFGLEQVRANNELIASVQYILFDPHENPQETLHFTTTHFGEARVLLAVSPDPANCAKIDKDSESSETIYMGPVAMEEAEEMRASIYTTRATAQVLKDRFDQAGGIPRLLFKSISVLPRASVRDSVLDTIAERQAFALNDLAVNPRRIDPGCVASEFKSLWSLYHLVPDSYYTSYTIELCCVNALKLLRRELLRQSVGELWNLYETTAEKHGTLRGIRYEAYAHKKITSEGIDLVANKLNAKDVSSTTFRVTIPISVTTMRLPDNDTQKLATQKTTAIQNSGSAYLIPDLPNYPVIDSAFVSSSASFALQMKAGRSKPLSPNHVNTVHATLGDAFVVVVPDDTTIRKRLAGAPKTMVQYVLVVRETLQSP